MSYLWEEMKIMTIKCYKKFNDDVIKRCTKIGRYYVVLIFTIISFLGCTHTQIIKTDMDNYLQNKEDYNGKHVVFTTDIENILEKQELYKGKEVELTAPITYVGKRGFPRWYVTLEKNGKKIRAYEDDYRMYARWNVLHILRKAKHEGSEVTVRGKLRSNGIELKQISYKQYVLNTDYPSVEQYYDWKLSHPNFNYYYFNNYHNMYYPKLPRMKKR